ncbi:MAG: cyclic nucleotide-binding domain-containing protein [SAR324 cluster bacterium]|nr:cyclic nucleotide-binding domain-containing protein [SAR324 cluster bacterium]
MPTNSQIDAPPDAAILEALRSLEPLASFADEELGDLVARCEIVDYDTGNIIIEEGEPSDNKVYFILGGRVSVYVNNRYILALEKPGQMVGEMSLIGEEPRSATVTADEPSRFLVISSALHVQEGRDADYKLRYYFTRMFSAIMAEKLRVTSDRAKLYEDTLLHSRKVEAYSSDLEDRVAYNLRQIRLFSHLVESAKDAIIITDLAGVVESANPALGELFGLPPESASGQHLRELLQVPGAEDSSWETIAGQAAERGWKGEVMVQGTDGDPIPAECTVSLVRDADQAPLAYSVILNDSRERKAYQERILDQQRALERAYEELQGLDRLKDRFLSRVSHELRTPLTSLLGSLELLTMPGMIEAGQLDEYAELMFREAQRLAGLVDKVLAISKIESGNMYFSFEMGRLDELIEIEATKMRSKALEKNIELVTDIKAPSDPVPFDELQIGSVIEQILDNAIKFTDSGTVRITLTQDAHESVITVSDTGCGIKSQNIGRIFNKLDQLEDNTDQPQGLGLGLPLSYLIVQSHAGRLLVNSEPGRGSVFTIGLPRLSQVFFAGSHSSTEDAE